MDIWCRWVKARFDFEGLLIFKTAAYFRFERFTYIQITVPRKRTGSCSSGGAIRVLVIAGDYGSVSGVRENNNRQVSLFSATRVGLRQAPPDSQSDGFDSCLGPP